MQPYPVDPATDMVGLYVSTSSCGESCEVARNLPGGAKINGWVGAKLDAIQLVVVLRTAQIVVAQRAA